ncbi:hypothetical protein A6V39_00805 [Candidatus Mycoplasma haematobovis]|uniref:Uncharacterized protein n=1 Tax=Candidatus Mycoplasma haematobovis TaxID=432608 RepID=A0A1A9QF04_9MOLU|nr:hypothetical protein [Candidatus Mycoplasma haematobovis]OAL10591.1 hypothetical protein A6V39_00805 [Candidatus Mycoplasma haematobovis]
MALLSAGKIATYTICAGVVGSAGVGSYCYLTRSTEVTIEELIKTDAKDKQFIGASDHGKVHAGWTQYKTDNTSRGTTKGKDFWNLENWAEQHNQENVPETFAKECQEQKKAKVIGKEDAKYTNFLKWCVK